METFALAAISLTVAASLLIKKNKRPLHITFAALCLGLFLEKTGAFFGEIFPNDFWKTFHALGLLLIPPLLIAFSRIFLESHQRPSNRPSVYAGLGSLLIAAAYFPFLFHWRYGAGILYLYIGAALVYCLVMLFHAIRHAADGIERKRFTYVAAACTVTALLSLTNIVHLYHPGVPLLSDIVLAIFIYFILTIIVYPRLPELYEIMVRAAIVFLLIVFVTITFYVVLAIFGNGKETPPFNLIFMTAFIIVIFIDPVKLILKKAGLYLFPEGKGSLNSLYTIDEEVEREKALLLEEMASTLAHEIRNPLGSIKGAAQYLKSDSESAENRELFDVITSEIDRLNNVVSRFLNYAKPGTIDPDTRSIADILERIIALITSQHLPEGIAVRQDIPRDLPPVWVDGEQMVQAVLNIALNAVEAMPQGGTLTLSARVIDAEDSPRIEIAVEDTGEGIEKKAIKRIFKPFYTTKGKGTGIGLAISQQIVKAHGGTIDATSSPGHGSVFHIRIPVDGL
ncbi:MAG: ATP-binding protein [Syntrophales bacterium]|nr:ATP-binding protein [Syntrophales bacterium]